MSGPLVIFHSINGTMHCDDGFGAAWVARKAMPDAEFHPGIYGQAPPDVAGREVWLLDFSYDYDTLVEMSYKARSIVVIDHHKTAAEALTRLHQMHSGFSMGELERTCMMDNMPVIGATFDMDRSGAIMAWDHFFPAMKPPDLLLRIEDGDLYRWAIEDSRVVQAALRSYPQLFDVWTDLMERPIEELASEGRAIRRFIDAKVRELIPNCRAIKIGDHQVLAVACPKMFASDLGNELCERFPAFPFSVTYEDGPTQRTYSLRSVGDFDVSAVARKFGGGGHRNAAGFQGPLP